MKSPEKTLSQIMQRFRFTEPADSKVGKMILESKKRSARAVLVSSRQYDFTFRIIFTLYHAARRAGLRPTMTQCRIFTAFLLTLLSASIVTGGAFTYIGTRNAAVPCRIVYSEEKTIILRNGKKLAPTGTSALRRDDIVITGPGERAYIRTDDRSALRMGSDSALRLSDTDTHRRSFYLMRGSVAVSVRRMEKGDSFAIRTENTSVTVKGTLFSITTGSTDTRITVSDGKVDFSSYDGSHLCLEGGQTRLISLDNVLPASALPEDLFAMKECARAAAAIEKPDASKEIEAIIRSASEPAASGAVLSPAAALPSIKSAGWRVGVLRFSGQAAPELRDRITDLVAQKITLSCGQIHVLNLRTGPGRASDTTMIITGTVEKIGSKYIITARMIDPVTSEILFAFTDTAESQTGIESAAERIVQNVSPHLK